MDAEQTSQRAGPRRADALLALAVAVLTVVGLLVTLPLLRGEGVVPPGPRETRTLLVLAAAQAIPLLWWRARPLAAFAAVLVVQVAAVAALGDAALSFRGLPTILVVGSIGLRLPARRALLVTLAGIAAEVLAGAAVLAAMGEPVLRPALERLGSAGPTYLLALAVGAILAGRAEARRRDRERDEHLRGLELEAALAEERRRIAGELHDVAAHHLSGMVVQAAAVERLVDRDPAAAKEGAAHLRRQGKETLDGLRSIVGLLRTSAPAADGTGGPIAPVAGLADLPQLVADTRTLGIRVDLDVPDPLPVLPPVADAAVYRIAQQAVSNALQHAPRSPVRIALAEAAGAWELQVANDIGPGHRERGRPGGAGLAVMRERAAAIGGRLEAGPMPDGIWRVRLVLPAGAGTAIDEDGGPA